MQSKTETVKLLLCKMCEQGILDNWERAAEYGFSHVEPYICAANCLTVKLYREGVPFPAVLTITIKGRL